MPARERPTGAAAADEGPRPDPSSDPASEAPSKGAPSSPRYEALRDEDGRPWIRPARAADAVDVGARARGRSDQHQVAPANGATSDGRNGPTGAKEGAAASAPGAAAPAGSTDGAPDPAALDDRFDEDLVHKIAPLFKLLRLYSRLEVSGLENVPDGPAILVANHTGWLGLDYAYTALSIYDARKRLVRGMAHHAWFARQNVGAFAHRLGLYEVSKATMRALLDRGDLVLIFPEGEKGAFKAEHERYQLQDFARGYVRVALTSGVPIVPVAIVGGEEANPSSRRIDSYEDLLNLSLPMPQNLFPRPVKWRISILPPVRLDGGEAAAADRDRVHAENEAIRARLQMEIARLVSVRGHPFL